MIKDNKDNKEKSKESKNLHDKYFHGTSKLWKNDSEKSIQNYYINDKIIGRQFIKNDFISYAEIYRDLRLNSNNIIVYSAR